MFSSVHWTNITNFIVDEFSGLTKTQNSPPTWTSKASSGDVFNTDVLNAGLLVYHNVNPGEASAYAIGLSSVNFNTVVGTDSLEFGFIFENGKVSIIENGIKKWNGAVLEHDSQNIAYKIIFDGAGNIDYYENDLLINSTPLSASFLNGTTALKIYAIAKTAYYTSINIAYNTADVMQTIVTDVTFEDLSPAFGEIISYPVAEKILFVTFSADVDQTSVTTKTVRLTKIVPNEMEDNIIVPLNITFDSSVIMRIVVPEFSYDCSYILEISNVETNDIFSFIKDTNGNNVAEFTQLFNTQSDPVEVALISGDIFNSFSNDIYSKLMNMGSLVDVDSAILKGDNFNFEYDVAEFNTDEGTYDIVLDSKNSPIKIQFNNADVILEKYIGQFIPEYVNYINDIIAVQKKRAEEDVNFVYDELVIKNLILLLIKNAAHMNAFKGNYLHIKLLIDMFSKLGGFNFISVEADPLLNFVYRITTDMPRDYWEKSIKPLCHPIGWQEIYIIPNIVYNDNIEPTGQANSKNFIFGKFLTNDASLFRSSLNANDWRFNNLGFEKVILGNCRFSLGIYSATLNFADAETVISAQVANSFIIGTTINNANVKTKHLTAIPDAIENITHIPNEFVWNIYLDNVKINTIKTGCPNVDFDFNVLNEGNFKVNITYSRDGYWEFNAPQDIIF